jgi:hypothetical protein
MNNPMNTESAAFGQEWTTLQNNYEQYERTALAIKLIAVLLCVAGLIFDFAFIADIVVVLLWVQESIFRTYQFRLGARLLRIEALMKQPDSLSSPFQLHSEWLANRKGVAGLIAEYIASSVKPTVAFPYVVLLLLGVIAYFGLN